MSKPPQVKPAKNQTTGDDPRPSGLLIAMTLAFFLARFLLPTEASVEGESLWLTQCTIALGMVWVWDRFAARQPLVRWDGLTIAALLLVGGHVVSGIAVLIRGGDKRAAVNMIWEWLALGVLFLAVRTVLQHPAGLRRLSWTVLSVVVALAGLGLYQHYVWLPANAADYTAKREELDRRESTTSFRSQQEYNLNQRRVAELQREFLRQGIALDGPGRKQWEDRLTSSREPFGTFGLANTFAGLLVALLFPAAALLAEGIRRRERWLRLVGPTLAVAVLAWCLVLTKSRTAWVGCLCGAGVWWWLEVRRSEALRRWIGWGMAGAAGIAVLVVAITISGGLDKQVISEAPKSMQYRLQYWTGSIGVVKEFPILGTGPGNFRPHYLKYKLPESSEEIRDPHNLILDVWCSGGLLGLAGLLLLLGLTIRQAAQLSGRDEERIQVSESEHRRRPTAWVVGVIGGFFLVTAFSLVRAEDDIAGRTVWLFAGTVAALILIRAINAYGLTRASLAAALIALVIHLCGAGGIEMPAITQVLLMLSVAISQPVPATASEARGVSAASDDDRPSLGMTVGLLGGSGLFAVLVGGCLTTATIPHFTRQSAMAAANNLWWGSGTNKDAESLYRRAIEADPLSAEPLRALSDMNFVRWQRKEGKMASLHRAIELRKLAIERDPNRYFDHWRIGDWYSDDYAVTRDEKSLDAAVAAFERAIELYPHNALMLAQYANVLSKGNRKDAAKDVAERAIAQDDINREKEHLDKILPHGIRKRLTEIQSGR